MSARCGRTTACVQEDINGSAGRQLAREGRKVVRLKGGDPVRVRPRRRGGRSAAGRRGADFEVVPGVTAALACAAQARIPLTHRAKQRGAVTLVTGHTKEGQVGGGFRAAGAGCDGDDRGLYGDRVAAAAARRAVRAWVGPRDTPAMLIERGGTAPTA
jgi:uroporphyrin-III C-methyltransferase/precorrin-2 dehydrogenase/sirohydrochlorin ferrochelatase